MLICRALLKYGYSNFSLEILKYCSRAKCIKWEQFFFDLLKPEYNILKIAGSSLGRNHSEKSRGKISASLLGIKKSEETRAKMAASQMDNSQIVEVTDLELNSKTSYPSFRAAARALNCDESSIRRYFKRNQIKPYKKRYVFTKHS
jgi:hypothetical protein